MTTLGSDSMLLTQLVSASVRTMILAATAGLLLTTFRVRSPSVRLFTWIAVLYAGLCMPVLGGMLPQISVTIPFRLQAPSKIVNPGAAIAGGAPAIYPLTIRPVQTHISLEIRDQPGKIQPSSWMAFASIRWTAWAVFAYLAVALFMLVRLGLGIWFAHRLVGSSDPIEDRCLAARLRSRSYLSRQLGFWQVRESQSASVPLTVGVVHPTIILPGSWRDWEGDKLAGVLTHEMSHMARRDCLSHYAALFHRAIFWFSPLAWWLNRHIIELAEEASDEEVLCGGTDQNSYARILLGFLENLQSTPSRIRWQGVSMASSGRAEKRLKKVLAWRGDKKVARKRSALISIIALAIPASFLVAASRPASPGQSGASNNPTRSEPAVPAAPAIPALPSASSSPEMPTAPAEGSRAALPLAPAVPDSPQDRNFVGDHHHGFSYGYGYDDEQRFVIVSGKTDAFTMSGSGEDARHAEKLKQRIPGDFIWFARDERSYIIRDQATVDRARQLWAPQEALGRKQAELGKQQEALSKQQQELGTRMQAVRVRVPDMTAELDKLKAELKQLGPDATVEQIGRIQSEIGQLQSKIGEIQSHAGDEQGKLGEEMGALGEKQGQLGQQQGELGRQQGELAEKAIREMKQLLDDAIKKGTAQPENPEPGGASL